MELNKPREVPAASLPNVVTVRSRCPPSGGTNLMDDAIYVGIVIVFFVGCGLYLRLCEKL